MELVQPAQMNIYQSNSYRKDLSWLHFNDEPRVLRDATSEGPIHTIWCYVIILDGIILRFLRKKSDFYLIFKIRFLRTKCEILLEFELDML